MEKKRLVWLDWMKTIGIYFIIWGHFSPLYMNDYIYSFSVPLFFIISGYLTKGYDNNKTLFIKLYHNLFLPYILICLLNLLLSPIIVHFNIHQFFLELIRIVAGGEETTGPIWYVYSLMVIRIIYQFLYKRRCLLYTMALFCILFSMYLNYNNLHLPWAVIANVIGFPLFMLGNRCRSFDVSLWVNSIYIKKYWMLLLVLLLSIINYTLSGINGPAYLYINEYGNNIILFYLLAILGTISVFIISVLLSKHSPQWMHTISMGTILILGFHFKLIRLFHHLFLNDCLNSTFYSSLLALVVLILFIPIINIVVRRFPLLIGNRK